MKPVPIHEARSDDDYLTARTLFEEYARTVGAIPIPDSVPGIYADPLRKPTRKRR